MFVAAVSADAALTAEQILDKVAATLTKPASTTVAFTFATGGQSIKGNMTVCKHRFTFNAGNLAVWYDGRTQWALQRSDNEVSITEPTPAELAESNPFSIITSYKKNYTCRLLEAPKGKYKVLLTARSKSAAVRTATVTVSASTFRPERINAGMGGNTTNVIRVNSYSTGKALPASYFRFDTTKNKKIEVIDLR